MDREEMQSHGLKIHKKVSKTLLGYEIPRKFWNFCLDMNFNSEKFIKRGDEQQILRGYFNLKWVNDMRKVGKIAKLRKS